MPIKKTSTSKHSETKAGHSAEIDTSNAEIPYEDGIAQLETLVTRMEDGALSLEEMLAAYERGMALHAHLDAILKRGEQRIQMLQARLPQHVETGASPAGAYECISFEVEE